MSVYQNIKNICSDMGISITSVEQKAELTNGSISKWDKSEPSAIRLKRVADVLGVPIEHLLKEE